MVDLGSNEEERRDSNASFSVMANKGLVIGGSVAVGVIVLIGALCFTSLKTLQSDEVALKYDSFQKELGAETYYEGLHMGPPGYQFITFASVFRTIEYYSLQCLNKDGVKIKLSISFQYRVQPRNLPDIVTQFRDIKGYEKILRIIGMTSIHDSCSRFNTSQFQSERGKFQEDLTDRLMDKYTQIFCDVTDLQINNIVRPTGYERAIKQKESAREDIEVAENERPQKLTEALTQKRAAETESSIIVNDAQTEARIVTKQALSTAEGILNDYKQEATTYRKLKRDMTLSNEGMINYLGIRTISESHNQVYINMKGPAITSYGNN